MPHGSRAAFQLRYPINFVVKHPTSLKEKPALRRLKPTDSRLILLAAAVCFQIGSLSEETIWKQCKDLVELTGIEPVTPCLQSRCSPS